MTLKAKMNRLAFWVNDTEVKVLKNKFADILQECGFNVLSVCEHYFQPYGWTGLYLLSESHLAIHTFPEEKKTYIELSSCVDRPFIKYLKKIKDIEKQIV